MPTPKMKLSLADNRSVRFPREKEDQPDADCDGGDHAGRGGELTLERAEFQVERLRQRGDLAKDRVPASSDHHALAIAVEHHRASEDAVRCVGKRGLPGGRRGALHRLGFAGQAAVVEAQISGAKQTGVRRNAITAVDDEHVAGHHVRRRDALLDPVAANTHRRRQASVQRLYEPARAILLPEAEHRVDRNDREDRPAELGKAGQKTQAASRPEQERQRMGHLGEEEPCWMRGPRSRQLVRARPPQATACFVAAKPGWRRLEPGEQLAWFERGYI